MRVSGPVSCSRSADLSHGRRWSIDQIDCPAGLLNVRYRLRSQDAPGERDRFHRCAASGFDSGQDLTTGHGHTFEDRSGHVPACGCRAEPEKAATHGRVPQGARSPDRCGVNATPDPSRAASASADTCATVRPHVRLHQSADSVLAAAGRFAGESDAGCGCLLNHTPACRAAVAYPAETRHHRHNPRHRLPCTTARDS